MKPYIAFDAQLRGECRRCITAEIGLVQPADLAHFSFIGPLENQRL
jgi:hypothetical protein